MDLEQAVVEVGVDMLDGLARPPALRRMVERDAGQPPELLLAGHLRPHLPTGTVTAATPSRPRLKPQARYN